jgi:hypothetical protein
MPLLPDLTVGLVALCCCFPNGRQVVAQIINTSRVVLATNSGADLIHSQVRRFDSFCFAATPL